MKGFFKCHHPEKYMGNANGIVYRSQWEFKVMRILDHDENVKRWASEEFSIKYISPVDKKWHRYFPDFYVEYKNGLKELIEVKPFNQAVPPVPSVKKSRRRLITEIKTYETNKAKWAYAQEWCKLNGVTFKVLTEKELFPKITRKRK